MRRAILLLAAVALLAGPAAAAPPGHLEGYVPAVAHTPGYFGSFWTTDVWIYQQGAGVIHLWFNPAGAGNDNTARDSVEIQLDRPVTYLEDVVGELFGESDALGSLHYRADGPVVVVTRTWTTDQAGASFGQTIPGVPLQQASFAGSGQATTLRLLANKRPGFRANLGLVNVSPEPITVLVDVFTAAGTQASGDTSFTVDLAPFAMTQINGVLERVTGASQDGLVIRTGVTSDAGAVMSYLSLVDNATNDASYQEAFRFGF